MSRCQRSSQPKRGQTQNPPGGGNAIKYTYDLSGNVSSVDQTGIDSTGNNSTFNFYYDDLGHRLEATSPLATSYSSAPYEDRTWIYASGSSTQVNTLLQSSSVGSGPSTQTTTYTYANALSEEIGKPTKVVDPQGGGTTINDSYDNYGNMVSSQSGSDTQTATYNQLGNELSASEGSHSTSYSYNADDSLASVTSDTQTTNYAYGAPASPPNNYTSSGSQDLASLTDAAGTTSYAYDGADRLGAVTDPLSGNKTNYGYDLASRMTSRGYGPGGENWIRCYDAQSGVLTAQYVSTGSSLSCSNSPATNEGYSIAYSEYSSYDVFGNVLTDNEATCVPIQGNPCSGPLNGTWTYTYDAAQRLASETPPPASGGGASTVWPAQTYTYDGSGNRVKVAATGATSTATCSGTCVTNYDSRGLAASYQVGSTTTYYCYDEIGNMTAQGAASQTQSDCSGASKTYTYDAFSRMTKAVLSAQTTNYSYDALSRLVSMAGAQTTTLTYSGSSQNVAQEVQGSTTTTFAYTAYGPLAEKSGGVTNFFLKDPHGDVVGLSTTAGVVSGQVAFSPWGEVITGSSSSNLLGFQGQVTDPSTGFTKTATRFYDPSQGRFTAQDSLFGNPIDPNTLNQYAYGNDSPVLFSDPSGLHGGTQVCNAECRNDVLNGDCTNGCQSTSSDGTTTGGSPCNGMECKAAPDQPFIDLALPNGVIDPSLFRDAVNDNSATWDQAAQAFGIPPSVLAALFVAESSQDTRSESNVLLEGTAGHGLCLLNFSRCATVSFGAFQIQVRRGMLVDSQVKSAVLGMVPSGPARSALSSLWSPSPSAVADRLSNDRLESLYAAAYISDLRAANPQGTSWSGILANATSIGNWNSRPVLIAQFNVAHEYFSYLDYP